MYQGRIYMVVVSCVFYVRLTLSGIADRYMVTLTFIYVDGDFLDVKLRP